MLLTEIILRLRATCPLFEQRVAGTQSFTAATSTDSDIGVPCAFVVPMSDTGKDREQAGPAQMITERFATVVCLDNSKDARFGRGLSATMQLAAARQQLANALMMWSPLSMPQIDGCTYARSQHLSMNNARIWHQFEWTARYFLAPQDPPLEDAGYSRIEAVIRGYFPEVDAAQVRKLIGRGIVRTAGDATPQTIEDTILDTVADATPAWIKFHDTTGRPPQVTDPGNVLFHGSRTQERPK